MPYVLRSSLGLLAALCLAAAPARAQERVESESRDAVLGYMTTQNVLIGRMARDCLAVLGRPETPQNFVRAWQARNAKYMLAVNQYMEKRLAEIAAAHGEARRDAQLQAWIVEARARADESWNEILKRGERPAVCQRSIGLIEAGAFDVNARAPMFGEIEALVQWAER